MRKTKRLLSILITLALLAGLIAVPAAGAETGTGRGTLSERFTYDPIDWARIRGDGSGGVAPSTLDLGYLAERYASLPQTYNGSTPEKYDLRERGMVSPVSDQNPFGSCWTFAALGSAESYLLGQGIHADLSNLHLAYFTYHGDGDADEYNPWPDQPYLDAGGNNPMAVGTLAAWKGPVYEETVPYSGAVEANDPDYQVDEHLRGNAVYHLQEAVYLPNGAYNIEGVPEATAQIIKALVMEKGAVSVSYAAGDQTTYYNADTCAWYNPEPTSIDHAVLLVGWDDNFPRDSFNDMPEKDGAWLIRNSWGTGWGDDGYFWLSYEDKSLSFGNVYTLEPADNYKTNYQYDLGWGYSLGFVPAEGQERDFIGYEANIFTARGDEQLEAVSFYTTDVNTRYEVSVYTGCADDNPTSGTLSTATASGTQPYAGYHTVELPKAVPLAAGEKFSVVVELVNPAYRSPMAVEAVSLAYGEEPEHLGRNADDSPEASFLGIGGKGGIEWEPAYGVLDESEEDASFWVTAACVKAFTNPVNTVSFSPGEGGVALNSTLKLTAPGGGTIYYTTDGGDPTESGTSGDTVTLSTLPVTVRAAVKLADGSWGPVCERTYTQAVSVLTDLSITHTGNATHPDLSDPAQSIDVYVLGDTPVVTVKPYGTDKIYVNGVKTGSATEVRVSLSKGETTTVEIESGGDGLIPTTYTVNFYLSALTYNFENETVTYDDNIYTLRDTTDKVVPNGGSVTPYIRPLGSEEVGYLLLTDKAGENSREEVVPSRLVAAAPEINYFYEGSTTPYGAWNKIWFDNMAADDVGAWGEGQEGWLENGYISLNPDEHHTVYVQKPADERHFASEIVSTVIPRRPAAPAAPTAASVTRTSITLNTVEGAQYAVRGGNWQDSPVFTGLSSGTRYHFGLRLAATAISFASAAATADLWTDESSGGGGSPAPTPAPTPTPAPVEDMADLDSGAWYYPAVSYVVEQGLMKGTSDTAFSPDAPMSRAMLWTVLYRVSGGAGSTTGAGWYDAARAWSVECGVSDGTNPDGLLTREQIAVMLYRAAGSPAASGPALDFTDADSASPWALDALRWAVDQGLMSGKGGGVLDPGGTATRAEVAQLLMNYCERAAR